MWNLQKCSNFWHYSTQFNKCLEWPIVMVQWFFVSLEDALSNNQIQVIFKGWRCGCWGALSAWMVECILCTTIYEIKLYIWRHASQHQIFPLFLASLKLLHFLLRDLDDTNEHACWSKPGMRIDLDTQKHLSRKWLSKLLITCHHRFQGLQNVVTFLDLDGSAFPTTLGGCATENTVLLNSNMGNNTQCSWLAP